MSKPKYVVELEANPTVSAILSRGLFEYSGYTNSYVFIDAMTCINARPSQHKDHGYLNGALAVMEYLNN